MTKSAVLSAVLAVALVSTGGARPAIGATKEDRQAAKRAALAAKVRDGVRRLGTGPDARVEVKRRDATKVAGYVASAGDAGFSVADATTGAVTQVSYDDVSKVKGHNLHTGWKIAIGVGALFALALVLVWTGAIGDAER